LPGGDDAMVAVQHDIGLPSALKSWVPSKHHSEAKNATVGQSVKTYPVEIR
jgi:hypothetical protein